MKRLMISGAVTFVLMMAATIDKSLAKQPDSSGYKLCLAQVISVQAPAPPPGPGPGHSPGSDGSMMKSATEPAKAQEKAPAKGKKTKKGKKGKKQKKEEKKVEKRKAAPPPHGPAY